MAAEETTMVSAVEEEVAPAEKAAPAEEDDGPVDWDNIAANNSSEDSGDGEGTIVIDLLTSNDDDCM